MNVLSLRPLGEQLEPPQPLWPNSFLFKESSDILINNRGRPKAAAEVWVGGDRLCWLPGATTIGVRGGMKPAGGLEAHQASPAGEGRGGARAGLGWCSPLGRKPPGARLLSLHPSLPCWPAC